MLNSLMSAVTSLSFTYINLLIYKVAFPQPLRPDIFILIPFSVNFNFILSKPKFEIPAVISLKFIPLSRR